MQGRLTQPISILRHRYTSPTDADFLNFSDPQAEGSFSTAATRCMADAYIQGQIKGRERIIRYYKRCRNALTITCRIPPEILTAIFSEVVQCAERKHIRSGAYTTIVRIDWIQSVSHVCSHWREVALATPNLWSDIPLSNPPWAQEMVRRSYPVPLTIKYQGPIQMSVTNNERWTASFETITEILRFHLPRIKSLTLDSWPSFDSIPFEHEGANSESTSILSLLKQPAPMIESLEIRLRDSEKNKLPYEMFTMSSRLRHLTLEDCGMAWDPELTDFGNLRSLHLHQQSPLSLYQLLTLLRQASRLESLHLERRNPPTGLGDSSMLHDIDPVILRYLERITLIGDLSYYVLLIHIVFSQNVCSIHLSKLWEEVSSHLAQALARKFDNCIEGSTLSLSLAHRSIRCWKSNDTTHIPSFCDSPTIDVNSFDTRLADAEYFWQSLRLDQLISLEIDSPLERGSWTIFGNLPKVQNLRVWSFQNEFFNVLHHGLVEKSTTDAQPVQMTFPALRNLTMFQCYLKGVANVESNSFESQSVRVVQLMLSCFELRKKAGLPLESLTLEECDGVDSIQLERLRGIIDQVDWIGTEEFDDLRFDRDYDEDYGYYGFGGPWYEDEETDEDVEPYIHDNYDYDDVYYAGSV